VLALGVGDAQGVERLAEGLPHLAGLDGRRVGNEVATGVADERAILGHGLVEGLEKVEHAPGLGEELELVGLEVVGGGHALVERGAAGGVGHG
jgi:hypothetical protein